MPRARRFQNRITAGRFTLPAAILISVACWVLTAILLPETGVQKSSYFPGEVFSRDLLPDWASSLLSFILYSIIGYFLIELNNAFAIIRMRASVQTAVYFLLIAVCPSLHVLYAGNLAAMVFLIALFFLFKSYQQPRPMSYLFHAFTFIGIGSLLFPQLLFFVPVLWIGARNFQSLNAKSFFASLTGWSMPYWFLLGYAYFHGQLELFYRPFRELATFVPVSFDFQPWELATLGYLLVLFLASSIHCLASGYEDKIRTRSYLNFLILLDFCIFVYIVLQPVPGMQLLPILFIGISILAGHLFVLTGSRSSNLFFICALAGLFILFGFNVWTLL